MPKNPHLDQQPKKHPLQKNAQELSERALRQAEDENALFYEENAEIARNVSLIQTGINEKVARGLTRNTAGQNGSRELAVVKEERIQSELYRAVKGNELIETERADSKNYIESENVRHLNTGAWTLDRGVRHMKRFLRGAASMVGGNNFIEARIEERFGNNDQLFPTRNRALARQLRMPLVDLQANDPANFGFLLGRLGVGDIDAAIRRLGGMNQAELISLNTWLVAGGVVLANDPTFRRMLIPIAADRNRGRRFFVAARLGDSVENLASRNQAEFENLAAQIGLGPNSLPIDFVQGLATLSNSQLRALASGSNPATTFIFNNLAFRDLMLLADIEQRESSKIGIAEVYDHQTLRKFWHDLKASRNPEYRELAAYVEDMMEQNSLFPLEKNPEGQALLAELRARLAAKTIGQVLEELRNIRLQELPPPDLDEAENKRLDDHRKELLELSKEVKGVLYSLISARKNSFTLAQDVKAQEDTLNKSVESRIANLELQIEEAERTIENYRERDKENKGQTATEVAEETAKKRRFEDQILDLDTNGAKSDLVVIECDAVLQSQSEALIVVLETTKEELRIKITSSSGVDRDKLENDLLDLETNGVKANAFRTEAQKSKKETDDKVATVINNKKQDLRKKVRESDDKIQLLKELSKSVGKLQTTNYPQAISEKQNEKAKLMEELRDLKVRGINSVAMEKEREELTKDKEKASAAKKALSELQDKARELAQKINDADVQKRIQNQWKELNAIKKFLADTDFSTDLETEIQETIKNADDIFTKFNSELIEKKTTPFTLLQRLMRRDYYSGRNLNPEVFNETFNEEANHYALIKAGLRVEDVKNIDLLRSSNDSAATFLKKGKIRRGIDYLSHGVSKGQNFIGLEPFGVVERSPDQLLKEIIDSEPEFAVFKGVDKFTTTRDLREILNKSGEAVKPETIERFALIIEEAISKYKHVPAELETGLRYYHWDLENLVLVLQKLRVEMWSRDFLSKIEKSGHEGEREHYLIKMLKESRKEDQKISKSIRHEVESTDALWRKLLVKDRIKEMLDKDVLEGMNKVKSAGVDFKKKQLGLKESAFNSAVDGTDEKARLGVEIDKLKNQISVAEKQIEQSKDLYQRVEDAKKYLSENKHTRAERKKYLQDVGLAQVYDKMSTNFRMQRAWRYTKGKVVGIWDFGREHVINLDKGRKAWSFGRLAATPVTWPLGLAWKAGTFPFRLVGRAAVRATHMPKRMLGFVHKGSMRSYLRDRVRSLNENISKLNLKQARLKDELTHAPYSWDKKRIISKINKLEEQKMGLDEDLNEYKEIATKKSLDLGQLEHFKYEEAANDNKAAAPTVKTKKAA